MNDGLGNTRSATFAKDSLIGDYKEIRVGDSVYFSRLNSHNNTYDTFSYLIWRNKYFTLKQADVYGFDFIEPNLQIYYSRYSTYIVERINGRYFRRTAITQNEHGQITYGGTEDYYFYKDGRIDKIREDGVDYIVFIYNKKKMLQTVNAMSTDGITKGKVFESYSYEYKYW